jgi:hypothetical protein
MLELVASSPAIDRFDGPEWALVIVATISAVSAIVGAVVANRSRQHSQVVRAQVENDHADAKNPNLRVDLDDKFEGLEHSVHKVAKVTEKIMTKLTDVEGDVSMLRAGYINNRTDIDSLMDTAAQEREAKRLWGPPPETRRERRDRDAR